MRTVERVHIYQIHRVFAVAKILQNCGKDMASKYDLHHWDNPFIKTLAVTIYCMLRNEAYLIKDEGRCVATFQLCVKDNALYFFKLGVDPTCSGHGYGSFAMQELEKIAKNRNLNKVRMEVYDKSEHAVGFYQKRGYSKIGETQTLKYTEIIMEKDI